MGPANHSLVLLFLDSLQAYAAVITSFLPDFCQRTLKNFPAAALSVFLIDKCSCSTEQRDSGSIGLKVAEGSANRPNGVEGRDLRVLGVAVGVGEKERTGLLTPT
jgi:hypothetical protein